MKATLIGASGLIGSELLQLLLNDPFFTEVHTLVRKPVKFSHNKLHQLVVDFHDQEALNKAIPDHSILFSCIETTKKKVNGDQQAYRQIDFDITINAAKIENKNMLPISSLFLQLVQMQKAIISIFN